MTTVAVGSAWTPSGDRSIDDVALPLTLRELWAYRQPAAAVTMEIGEGCQQRETHSGRPCTFQLEPQLFTVVGHCLSEHVLAAPSSESVAL